MLSVCLLAGILISLGVSILLNPEMWRRYLVMVFIFTGLSHILVVSSRMFFRGLLDGLTLWSESQFYRRGGIVRRVLLYGAGGRCVLYLSERALNAYDGAIRRMIVGLIDDDTNLRFRRVGGYVVLGTGGELEELVTKYRIDEIIITAQVSEAAHQSLAEFCGLHHLQLSEWHYEERAIHSPEPEAVKAPAAEPAPCPGS